MQVGVDLGGGDVGVAALMASPYLRKLTRLELWSNKLKGRGAAALKARREASPRFEVTW